MTDLWAIFDSVKPVPPGLANRANTFSAVPLRSWPSHRLARDSKNAPCVLLHVRSGEDGPAPDVELRNLSVRHDISCKIVGADRAAEVRSFSVVQCAQADSDLQRFFLNAVASILPVLGDSPSRSEVIQAIDTLVEVFRRLSQPAKKTIRGLWGELALISFSREPSALLRAWHKRPTDLHDFAEGKQRIEVKTSAGPGRVHGFNLSQIEEEGEPRIAVASIIARESDDGATLFDLMREVMDKLAPEDAHLGVHMEAIVADSLGEGWRQALRARFDVPAAQSSLRFFGARSVPRPGGSLPPQVTEVHFKVDLSELPPESPAGLSAKGGLFAAAVPVLSRARVE